MDQEPNDSSKADGIGVLRRWDWSTIALVLGIKVLLLSFGVQAAASLSMHHPSWLEIWRQWDATNYLRIAEHGYSAAGDNGVLLVFFPLYPWLVRAVAFLVDDYMLSALFVSGIASIAA